MRLLSLFVLIPMLLACPGERPRGGGGNGGIADDDDSSTDDDDAADDDDGQAGGPVDLLLVVDNSSSMTAVHEELSVELPQVLSSLVTAGVDFRLGVTTTDIDGSGNGRQGNIRSSAPVGAGECGADLLDPTFGDLAGALALLVDVGVMGSGDERGLQAAGLALCKAQPVEFWDTLSTRPEDDPARALCSGVPDADRTCNAGFARPEANVVVVIVSDEGDASYRSEQHPPPQEVADCVQANNDDPDFGQCDCRLEWWLQAFETLAPGVRFVTVGPTYQNEQEPMDCDGVEQLVRGPCNGFGNDVCAIDFYQQAACLSGGFFAPLNETTFAGDPGSCDLADFGPIARDLTALLGG